MKRQSPRLHRPWPYPAICWHAHDFYHLPDNGYFADFWFNILEHHHPPREFWRADTGMVGVGADDGFEIGEIGHAFEHGFADGVVEGYGAAPVKGQGQQGRGTGGPGSKTPTRFSSSAKAKMLAHHHGTGAVAGVCACPSYRRRGWKKADAWPWPGPWPLRLIAVGLGLGAEVALVLHLLASFLGTGGL